MAATIIIGTQFGDEGKGKIIDYLALPVKIVSVGPKRDETIIST